MTTQGVLSVKTGSSHFDIVVLVLGVSFTMTRFPRPSRGDNMTAFSISRDNLNSFLSSFGKDLMDIAITETGIRYMRRSLRALTTFHDRWSAVTLLPATCTSPTFRRSKRTCLPAKSLTCRSRSRARLVHFTSDAATRACKSLRLLTLNHRKRSD